MPIPHLQHKIHSPTEWPQDKTKVWAKNRPGFSGLKTNRRFFDIKIVKANGKIDWLTLTKKFLPYFAVIVLVGAIGLLGIFAWLSKDLPDPNKLLVRAVAQSTKIYDKTGEHLLYDIHGAQQRTLIPLNEIPDYAIKATLALEDQHFYEHQGFSIWGMVRGVILQALKGQRLQGGSTLTQQLVKNAILTNERSITRKIKELILAYKIEKKYTKDEILQMYFNEIPYGSTAYGIEAAAQTYFGKSARDLRISEAAVIASMIQRPTYYSPNGSHVDELIGRQHYCLDQMAKLGYITKDQATEAKNDKLVFKNRVSNITAPHFVFFVKELLAQKYGDSLIEQGGYKIISSLDYDLQKKAEEIVKQQADLNGPKFNANNASLVAIDVATGQILAMVGSKDFFDDSIDGQVNVAISPRQPGSSFKPIVYTAAFKKGFVPETEVYDLDTVFKTEMGDYTPHDYDLKERGPISLRQALAGSLNTPAVKMIYLTGIDNVLNLADGLDYTTLKDRSRYGLSLVLGGGEVKLLEHTNAFATLARDGQKLPYAAVLKMEDSSGKILEEFQNPRPQKVLDPNITRMTTDILSDNGARAFIFGERNYLTLPDRPVAAKTGTTNDYHDAWTLGYTPQIAVGVWAGNSNNDAMKKGADGSVIAAPIWQKFMVEAVKNLPVQSFVKPVYQVPNKPMVGGDASGVKVKIDSSSGLLATDATPPEQIVEKVYKQAHSILYYVDKNDPLGPIPARPENDPNFATWEEAVSKWAAKNNIINEEPPTGQDNIHKIEDRPKIKFSYLQNNQTIESPDLDVRVEASAPRGINKVAYYLDENLLTTSFSAPFDVNLNFGNIINGSHVLTAKAYDDLGNVGQTSVTLNLRLASALNINWLKPAAGENLKLTDFPINLSIRADDSSRIKKVDFFYQAKENNKTTWINFVDSPKNNTIVLDWVNPPNSGSYKLYILITDRQNNVLTGPGLNINLE